MEKPKAQSVDWSAQDVEKNARWLDSHINFEKNAAVGPPPNANPGKRLDNLRAITAMMGDPQELYPSIHVTGTNGKTSTSRMISTLLMANGLRTGLYTSPHLERVNERICLDLAPIEDEELSEVLHSVALVESITGIDNLSYFEIMTAAALRAFADAPVDVATIEVGVGGTFDATNIVDGRIAVITNIGLDHTNYLGPTRADIAKNKAGIIKAGSFCVVGEHDTDFVGLWQERDPEVLALIDRDFGVVSSSVAVGGRVATLRTPSTTYDDVFMPVHGAHQSENAAIALTAVEAFFARPLDEAVVRAAFESFTTPGRLEIVHRQPLMLVDGAHNAEGAQALRNALDEDFNAFTDRVLILGVLRPHDPREFLEALDLARFKTVIATQAASPRAVNASEVGAAATAVGAREVITVSDVHKAVEQALAVATDDDLIVGTGSLYLTGDLRKAIRDFAD